MAQAVSLDALRARIREIEGAAPVHRGRQQTGVAAVDQLVDGFPCPGIVELCGSPGSGRIRLALALVRERTRARQSVAWVDSLRQLYPPALAAMGISLDRILLIRPVADGTRPELWAAEQLLRSGCFGLVVLETTDANQGSGPRALSRSKGHVLARAAEKGASTALVLGARPSRHIPAELRLQTGGGAVSVLRDRVGVPGRTAPLPDWLPGTRPLP